MKRVTYYLIVASLLFFPFFANAKVTCSVRDKDDENIVYSATIDVAKTNLSISDNASITLNGDDSYKDDIYKVDYDISDPSVLKIENDMIIPLAIGKASVKIYVYFANSDNSCSTSLDINVLSNDATLKSLTLEEVDISALFKPTSYKYEVNVPYSYEQINIIAEPNDENATIVGGGKQYINEGENSYEIIVTAEDGSTLTYTVVVNRNEPNDDATLKSLIVEGYSLNPKFSNSTLEYSLNVGEDVESINVKATASSELATVLGGGVVNLATGENKIYITVIAEDKSEMKYTLIVNKSGGAAKLSNFEVIGYNLNQPFAKDVYTYYLTINSDVNSLEINVQADDNSQIEIVGNENLVVGNNDIIIRVSQDNKISTTYKLVVTKLSADEQQAIEKNNKLLTILLIIFIASVVIMIALITMFVIRNYKRIKKLKKIKNLKANKNKKKKRS